MLASVFIGSALLYAVLVVRMVVRFSFGISQFMEKMHVCLKGVTVIGRYQSFGGGERAMFLVWV